jgi:hypothetical protein
MFLFLSADLRSRAAAARLARVEANCSASCETLVSRSSRLMTELLGPSDRGDLQAHASGGACRENRGPHVVELAPRGVTDRRQAPDVEAGDRDAGVGQLGELRRNARTRGRKRKGR